MARPTIIPKIQGKLIQHVRAGNYIETACTACGISEQVYYIWKQNHSLVQTYLIANLIIIDNEFDTKSLPPEIASKWVYWRFIELVKQAEAAYEIEAISNIRNAERFDKNWVAEMTVLSRRVRKHWQETQGIDQDTLKAGLMVFDKLLTALQRPGQAQGPELQPVGTESPEKSQGIEATKLLTHPLTNNGS